MRASVLPEPPGRRLLVVESDGGLQVVLRRRSPAALLGGVLAVTAVGGAVVWGVQSTLARAGGLETSLADAGIGPILALTVVGIAMPLGVIALMVLRPGPLVLVELSEQGVVVTEDAGERTSLAWNDVDEVKANEAGLAIGRAGGDAARVGARLDAAERDWLVAVVRSRGTESES